MRPRAVVCVLLIAAAWLAHDTAVAQSGSACESPAALSGVRNEIIKRGTNDSGWVFRLGLNVPAFRMKDVKFDVEGVRTIGPWRRGTDCEITLRMTTPVDVLAPNMVIAEFRYVVVPASGGGIEVELY